MRPTSRNTWHIYGASSFDAAWVSDNTNRPVRLMFGRAVDDRPLYDTRVHGLDAATARCLIGLGRMSVEQREAMAPILEGMAAVNEYYEDMPS